MKLATRPDQRKLAVDRQTAVARLSATAERLPNRSASSGPVAVVILSFDYAAWIVVDPARLIGLFLVSLWLALDEIAAGASWTE